MSAVTVPIEKIQHWIGSLPHWVASRDRAEGREAPNGAATASYLFGILSPLPFLGLLFGVAAVLQGAEGLRYAHRHPEVGGALECRIGIALGAFFALLYLSVIVILIAIML